MALRWQNIVIDCTDPLLVASFWSEALGLELHGPEDGELWIEPGGESPDILFLHVPEGKSVKDRIHLDLRPDDQAAEVERLISLGARPHRHRSGRRHLGGDGRPRGQRVLRPVGATQRPAP